MSGNDPNELDRFADEFEADLYRRRRRPRYELVMHTGDPARAEPVPTDLARHVLGRDPVTIAAVTARLGIRCLACGAVSWNPHDVEQRYCGACHRVLDDDVAGGAR